MDYGDFTLLHHIASQERTEKRESESGEPKKVRKVSTPVLKSLPYRVIVCDILSFYKFKPTDTKQNESNKSPSECGSIEEFFARLEASKKNYSRKFFMFRAFGYFNTDKSRNIWFLFRCVVMNKKFFEKNVIVDVSQIESLFLAKQLFTREFVIKRTNLDISFRNLKTLDVGQTGNFRVVEGQTEKDICDLCFSQWKFPRLSKIHMVDTHQLEGKGWNLPTLESLKIEDSVSIKDDVFGSEIPKLNRIVLKNTVQIEGKGWNKFENLVVLVISGCPTFSDTIFVEGNVPKLVLLNISDGVINGKLWRELPDLRILSLSDVPFCDDIFRQYELKYISEISFIRLPNATGKNWVGECKRLHFLNIAECENFSDDIFSKEHSVTTSLRTLHLQSFEVQKSLTWKKMDKISRSTLVNVSGIDPKQFICVLANCYSIVLSRVHIPAIDENGSAMYEQTDFKNCTVLKIESCVFRDFSFMEKNKFSNLKTLIIHNQFNLEDLGCANIESVAYLRIDSSDVSDNFFIENEFENLKFLNLNQCGEVHGKFSKTFKSLLHMVIRHCESVEDDLFANNSYPRLQKLAIGSCGGVEGENWNDIASLEELLLVDLESLGDELFQQTSFENLKRLALLNVQCVRGESWKTLSTVNRFATNVENWDWFSDEFKSKKFFNKDTKMKHNGTMHCGDLLEFPFWDSPF